MKSEIDLFVQVGRSSAGHLFSDEVLERADVLERPRPVHRGQAGVRHRPRRRVCHGAQPMRVRDGVLHTRHMQVAGALRQARPA